MVLRVSSPGCQLGWNECISVAMDCFVRPAEEGLGETWLDVYGHGMSTGFEALGPPGLIIRRLVGPASWHDTRMEATTVHRRLFCHSRCSSGVFNNHSQCYLADSGLELCTLEWRRVEPERSLRRSASRLALLDLSIASALPHTPVQY